MFEIINVKTGNFSCYSDKLILFVLSISHYFYVKKATFLIEKRQVFALLKRKITTYLTYFSLRCL